MAGYGWGHFLVVAGMAEGPLVSTLKNVLRVGDPWALYTPVLGYTHQCSVVSSQALAGRAVVLAVAHLLCDTRVEIINVHRAQKSRKKRVAMRRGCPTTGGLAMWQRPTKACPGTRRG
ncbi:hypothetical protein GGTG_02648 [Gaeumannomyces tritici R3-111a-1]|uniref:Uncharacterized protein n=1 Tax=Gaeumannomyces tritici (strain R3-111a-1) TaxID=644352 RepID=J3NMZ0_GAET3|nr:hypothetical protein GGTG_02648 [Gaeumannomyces tritici R3-111a-1]EJT77542.1 hypothetical protein GGTG_02648 [Gaeumannomyces tritici R3-111a-1]